MRNVCKCFTTSRWEKAHLNCPKQKSNIQLITDNLPMKKTIETMSNDQYSRNLFSFTVFYLTGTKKKQNKWASQPGLKWTGTLITSKWLWLKKRAQPKPNWPSTWSECYSLDGLIYTNAFIQTLLHLVSTQGQSFQGKEGTQVTLVECEWLPSATKLEVAVLKLNLITICLTLVFQYSPLPF